MREYWPIKIQLWREMAHFVCGWIIGHDRSDLLCERHRMSRSNSIWAALYCQYRYPSPRRSVLSEIRPTPLSCGGVWEFGRSVGVEQKSLVLRTQTSDSAPHKTKQKKGSNQCYISVLSSPQPQLHLCRHVWTMILNAALPVQPQVPLFRTPLVVTPSQVPSLVAQLARCVTKLRAFAVNLILSLIGAFQTIYRRSGFPLSGGFAF